MLSCCGAVYNFFLLKRVVNRSHLDINLVFLNLTKNTLSEKKFKWKKDHVIIARIIIKINTLKTDPAWQKRLKVKLIKFFTKIISFTNIYLIKTAKSKKKLFLLKVKS